MKKMKWNNRSFRTMVVSVLLLAAVVGVAMTVALGKAKSNDVVNQFEAAKIDTEIDEELGGNLTKKVKVTNSAGAKSPAYIRVRMTVSPESDQIHLWAKDSDSAGDVEITTGMAADSQGISVNGWQFRAEDSFWYYLSPVKPGEATNELLDYMTVGEGYQESFDVTVYQEACVASGNGGTLETVVQAFEKATQIQSSEDK